MKSRNKVLKYAVLGLSIGIVIVLLLLPSLLKNYLIKNSKELVGRQLDMDNLKINYFTGTFKVYDFKLYEANDSDIFIAFDTLILNTAPYKSFGKLKAVDQFYLQGLDINIVKQDTTYNFDDLLAFHTPENGTKTDVGEEEAFKYVLENLELKDASIHLYDSDVDHTSEIEDLSLFIPVIAWDQENDSNADFEFNIGTANVKALFNIHPGSRNFDSTIKIDGLQLNSFKEYVMEFANINRIDGTVHANILMAGNLDNPIGTLVSGELDVNNPLMTDQKEIPFLSGEKILCKLREINFEKNSYIIDDLVFEQPYVKLELDSVSNNLFRIFNYGVDSTETVTDEGTSLYYALNHVQVNEGSMDYTDNLTGQPFDYHLSNIKIDTDSIFSDSDWVDVLATMTLNDRGKLEAEVGFNPQDPMYTTLDIAIEDFLLSDLNIYSSYYIGHSILTGDMLYFSDTEITNGQLESENHFLIKNVKVENLKGGFYAVPLKLAVWLLKDKNGDIELDIPVRGDMDDPQVNTWSLVMNTLKKKIFNTTKNPIIPLARYIDADPDDLKSMAVQFPDTSLTSKQTAQLDLLLQLEREKEGLKVEMNFIGIDSIQTKLTSSYAMEQYKKNTNEDAVSDTDGFQAFIHKQLEADSLDMDNSLKEYGLIIRADSLAMDYINSMITKVDSYLKARQPETRIKVGIAKVSDKDNIDAAPQFKMEYSLKEDEEETPPEYP